MKSIVTLLSVAFITTVGFTGCCTQGAQKTCPMTKKSCTAASSCCATSAATCPMTKKKSAQ